MLTCLLLFSFIKLYSMVVDAFGVVEQRRIPHSCDSCLQTAGRPATLMTYNILNVLFCSKVIV